MELDVLHLHRLRRRIPPPQCQGLGLLAAHRPAHGTHPPARTLPCLLATQMQPCTTTIRRAQGHHEERWESVQATLPLPVDRDCASNRSLSFKPNFSSGMPDKYDRIFSAPKISERKMLPLEPTRMLTDSTTSRKISFLRYLMPSLRHDTTPVTAGGGFAICG